MVDSSPQNGASDMFALTGIPPGRTAAVTVSRGDIHQLRTERDWRKRAGWKSLQIVRAP